MARWEPTSHFERKTWPNIAPERRTSLCPLVRDGHDRVNSASNEEIADDLEEARLQELREVGDDPIRDRLVEVPLVAERPEVQLERLQLDAGQVGNVTDRHRGEIRLPRLRAQTGELGAGE